MTQKPGFAESGDAMMWLENTSGASGFETSIDQLKQLLDINKSDLSNIISTIRNTVRLMPGVILPRTQTPEDILQRWKSYIDSLPSSNPSKPGMLATYNEIKKR